MTYAVGLVALAGLGSSTHLDRVAHPACNLVISNVAGAKEIRYLNGARLLGIYPVSALAASIGLNATWRPTTTAWTSASSPTPRHSTTYRNSLAARCRPTRS